MWFQFSIFSISWQKCALKRKILPTASQGQSSLSADTDGEILCQSNKPEKSGIHLLPVCYHSSHSQKHRFKVTQRWPGAKIKQDNKQLGGPCYTLDCSEDLKFHRRKTNMAALGKHTMSRVLGKHPHHSSRKIYNTREELPLYIFVCLSLHHMMWPLFFIFFG